MPRKGKQGSSIPWLIKSSAFKLTENATADEGSVWKPGESTVEGNPETLYIGRIATPNLIQESVDAVDVATFVVASEEEEVVRIARFVGQQQDGGLDALSATVHVVWKVGSVRQALL
jgi:hypothetical protein